MRSLLVVTDIVELDDNARPTGTDVLHFTTAATTIEFGRVKVRYVELLCMAVFLLLQIVISTGNYSGHSRPPMFGDFEAQRHWMEITTSLPMDEWYTNTTRNDLNYWGLDYPPLTAYHSWLLGKLSAVVDPSWTALGSSRGIETPVHKLFMRFTVILTMTLLYAPAVLAMLQGDGIESRQHGRRLLTALCYPGLLFVDNGHFQYNHVALGFFLWAVHLIGRRRHIYAGSIVFVLALNFKQMELYHALPIFVYLLAICFRVAGETVMRRLLIGVGRVAKLGAVVVATFVILWAPLVWTDCQRLVPAVARRLFPLSRGVFEDKVANFWFASSILLKMRGRFFNEHLAVCSTVLVLLAVFPSLVLLFRHATERNLRICLVISSMAFYLFSFQVHEKTILQAAVPTLFVMEDETVSTRWLLSTSLFSLIPLCVKDGMPEIAALFLFYHALVRFTNKNKSQVVRWLEWVVSSAMFVVGGSEIIGVSPLPRYPHLFTVLNALLSFSVFSSCFVAVNILLLTIISLSKNKEH